MAKAPEVTLEEVNGVWTPVAASASRRAPRQRSRSRVGTEPPRDRHSAPPPPSQGRATAARLESADRHNVTAPVDPACSVCGAPAKFGVKHGWGVTPICAAHAAVLKQGQQAAASQFSKLLTGALASLFKGGSR